MKGYTEIPKPSPYPIVCRRNLENQAKCFCNLHYYLHHKRLCSYTTLLSIQHHHNEYTKTRLSPTYIHINMYFNAAGDLI